MPALVSGEAVPLDLRHATFASRGVAVAIDVAVQLTLLGTLLAVLFAALPALDPAAYAALSLLLVILVMIALPVLIETLTRGRSLGKAIMGLRVLRDDGGSISGRHALVRGLAGFFLDFWVLGFFGAVALVVSLASPAGKRAGDHLAGTIVVRERLAPRTGHASSTTGPRADWTRTVDLTDVEPSLYQAAQQFLARRETFTAPARDRIAHDLAASLREATSASPPPGTPDEDVVSDLVAERRARLASTTSQASPAAPAPGAGAGNPWASPPR
ncbi:RDD family protein [Hoyosella sp. G463]|uniref:RDD family protein n=1 Tax=Lolliginicoccus lacisalsi TaxID=2742202 RepID=A0A927J9R7_9ACTN|nr:RDD family protein [Lolliginicoccus lacisalsi]MBD8504945.1 RDD family protein [Lolliginicoccus lacisalsi]